MRDAGSALMGIGIGQGDNRASEAARTAVSSPLLESSIEGATGILLNITGPTDLGLFEVNEAAEVVTSAADQNANVIFGAVIDENVGDEVRVTVIATGFGTQRRRRAARAAFEGLVAAAAAEHRVRGRPGRARRSVVPARRLTPDRTPSGDDRRGPGRGLGSPPVQTLRRTPLYEKHVAAGARIVPFAGWEMPVQYEGVHRRAPGGAHRRRRLRRLAHGRARGRGPDGRATCCSGCSRTTSTRLAVGDAQYTLLTNEDGGIVDDLIVYRLGRAPVPAGRQRGEPRGRLPLARRNASCAAPTSATSPTSTRCSPCRARGRSSGSGSSAAAPSRGRWASSTASR